MSGPVITCPEGTDTPVGASRGGDYSIGWSGPDGAEYRLVETNGGGPDEVLYEGGQLASSVTGRREGDYSYRVGIVEGGEVATWSDSCTVLVRPYSLSVAFTFFGFGLLVTLATVVLIVKGHRAHRRGEIG